MCLQITNNQTEPTKNPSNLKSKSSSGDLQMEAIEDDSEGVVDRTSAVYDNLVPVKGVDIAVNCLPSYIKLELNKENAFGEEFRVSEYDTLYI